MQKEIVIVGLNHRSAPIEVRESVAFENGYVRDALVRLRGYPAVQESVILSTCNRVEVVAAVSDTQTACHDMKIFLDEQRAGHGASSLEDHLYTYRGADAVRHLFRVAASLDSNICGSPTTMESRLAATRNKWRTASAPR